MKEKLLKFASTKTFKPVSDPVSQKDSLPWHILVVDDEQAIHDITRIVLAKFRFDNRAIKLFFAHSAKEAKELLSQPNNFAVLILDVVMETGHAGLELVSYIRNVINNQFLRIILRTGQPGQAPEHRVIADYDINDYRTKTELTSEKMYSCLTTALRSYRDINTIRELARTRSKLQNKVNERNLELEAINLKLKAEIEERYTIEALLESTNSKLDSIINNSTALISLKDVQGCYDLVNKKFALSVDYKGDTLIGKKDEDIFPEHTSKMIRSNDLKVLNSGKAIQCEETLQVHGEKHYYLCVKFPLFSNDGHIYRICSIATDITERLAAQNKALHLAQYDALTGLPNRTLFIEKLKQVLDKTNWKQYQIAVMFIDLDRFKLINDTLGHDVGDQLLIKVAQRLKSLVHENDSICRLGGDEFAILLTDLVKQEDIISMVERVLYLLAESYIISKRELIVTPSIGISRSPVDGKDIQTLLKKADVAMYKAKTSGRNAYRFYLKEDERIASQLLSMEVDLRNMLNKDKSQLFLLYQPKFAICNEKFSSVEALIRWQHPKLGIISPDQFIPLLEETGLIIEAGEWVIKEACLFATRMAKSGFETKVSVNLSSRQLKQKEITYTIQRILRQTQCNPTWLEFEITESMLADDIEYTKQLLEEIASMGISLALDDFGTGYSSMNYLKRLPFNTLKIDSSFITDAPQVEQDRAIVTTIAQLANNLHMGVVAEGVETAEQFDLIKNIFGHTSENQIQGYFFSKPVLEDELLAMYKKFIGSKNT